MSRLYDILNKIIGADTFTGGNGLVLKKVGRNVQIVTMPTKTTASGNALVDTITDANFKPMEKVEFLSTVFNGSTYVNCWLTITTDGGVYLFGNTGGATGGFQAQYCKALGFNYLANKWGGVLNGLISRLSAVSSFVRRWRHEQVVQYSERHHHETERRCYDYIRQFVSNDRVIGLRWKVLCRQKCTNTNWVQRPLYKNNVHHGQQDGNGSTHLRNKLPSVYESTKYGCQFHGVLLQNHRLTSERGCC